MPKPGWTICGLLTRVICVALAVAPAACSSTPDTLESGDPAGRMHAAGEAAAIGDTSAIPFLVEMLSSDDPAERMVAIGTLQRLTGQRFNYDPTAEPSVRFAAAEQWERWAASPAGKEVAESRVSPGGAPVDPATVVPRTPRTDR